MAGPGIGEPYCDPYCDPYCGRFHGNPVQYDASPFIIEEPKPNKSAVVRSIGSGGRADPLYVGNCGNGDGYTVEMATTASTPSTRFIFFNDFLDCLFDVRAQTLLPELNDNQSNQNAAYIVVHMKVSHNRNPIC